MARLGSSAALIGGALAVALPGAAAASSPLSGSLVGSAVFPNRALAVWDSSPQPLDPSKLTVTENGGHVADLSVTPIAEAGRGDFGTIAVVDDSSKLTATQRAAELAAVRALSGVRTGNQQLGLITYGSTPNETLPLTDNSVTIARALGSASPAGAGENVLPALSLAIGRLRSTVNAGAVVVIAPGSNDTVSGASVAAAAHDAGIRLFTVGVQGSGRASRAGLARLRAAAGGSYVQVPGAKLAATATSIWSSVIRGYVVRYRSLEPHGRSVVVTVRVAGMPGTATAGYASPALPKPAPKPVVHKAAPAKPKGFPVPAAVLSPQPPVALAVAPAQSSSFWGSSHSVVIVALIVAALLGLALVLLLSPLTKRAVHTRVETFIAGDPEPGPNALDDTDAPRGRLAKALAERPWWPEFIEQIDVGRVRRSPEQLVRLAVMISLGAAVLGSVIVGNLLVAIPLLLVGPFAVRAGVRHAAKRQRARFGDQLPAHLQDLAGAMRAGRSLVGALAAVAETADEPIKGELDRALADERLGLPLEQTLTAIGKRMHSEDIEQVALIAALNRRSGSNVAEALDQVAEGSRERADMRRELTAMTGQARISSWVLTALPPVLLLAITLIDPKYARPLYHSVPGALVLIVAGLMVIAGWFVMKRIVDVEV